MTDYENVGNCVDTLGNGDFARWNTHVADSFYVEHASAREFWNTSFGRGTDLFEDPPSVPLVGGGEGGRESETKTVEEGRKAADALPDRKTIDDFGVAAPCLCSVTPPNFLREHPWGRRCDFETGTPKTRSRPFSRVARYSPTKYEN